MDERYSRNPQVHELDIQIEVCEKLLDEYEFLLGVLQEITEFQSIARKREVTERINDFTNRRNAQKSQVIELKEAREKAIIELNRAYDRRARFFFIPYIVLVIWVAVFGVFIFCKQDIIFGIIAVLIGMTFVRLISPQKIQNKMKFMLLGISILIPIISIVLSVIYNVSLQEMIAVSAAPPAMSLYNYLSTVSKNHSKAKSNNNHAQR